MGDLRGVAGARGSRPTKDVQARLREVLARAERAEAERDHLAEALKAIVDHGHTHDQPCWAVHSGDCADTFQELARVALSGLSQPIEERDK